MSSNNSIYRDMANSCFVHANYLPIRLTLIRSACQGEFQIDGSEAEYGEGITDPDPMKKAHSEKFDDTRWREHLQNAH